MIARLLAAVLVVVAVLLAWILWQRRAETQPRDPTPPPAATATVTPEAAPTPVEGYRLAGTAAGGRGRYAVFADPGGTTEMYRVGEEIPGLGALTRVGELEAEVATAGGGQRSFRVRPAPTRVPENTPTPAPTRRVTPTPDLSESESSPSDDLAPPAS